jgi:asparagine synthase (glutamine-hydrolysing)
MADAIAHRGPDGSGFWFDEELGLCLGHRRLSVIDLSPAGAQPMASVSGRFILTFNGEIYNFQELRKVVDADVPGMVWRSRSDTEVLLAAIEIWGIEAALARLEGMFAIAVWDRVQRRLTLARDRFGEKPLYYTFRAGRLFFGSELRALAAATPLNQGDVAPQAIDRLVRSLCVPAPLTIFSDVYKLAPGTMLSIKSEHLQAKKLPEAAPWWSAEASALAARRQTFRGSETEAVEELTRLLGETIRTRLISDVPVGLMLSGGIDSTVVCGLAQAIGARDLRAFTIGFGDRNYDESHNAIAIARALGANHTTIQLGTEDIAAIVPQMAYVYDEPFADSSSLATTLVSRSLREHVTVALSGDGGDELFGGYIRYLRGPRLWSWLSHVPRPLKAAIAMGIEHIGPSRLATGIAKVLNSGGESSGRIDKALRVFNSRSRSEFYCRLIENWPLETPLTRGVHPFARIAPIENPHLSHARQMMLADTLGYLPDDILTKVDRAAMSTSLETRAPFLDSEIYAFAWSLPDEFLFKGAQGKSVLRQVAGRLVPSHLTRGVKRGFAVPLGSWLRGPLKDWASDLLSVDRLTTAGHFHAATIESSWKEHRSGAADHSQRLWPVLMFESWRDAWASKSLPN